MCAKQSVPEDITSSFKKIVKIVQVLMKLGQFYKNFRICLYSPGRENYRSKRENFWDKMQI